MGGGGCQHPLRSQLCHQLTSCGFGRASCHVHSGVQQLLLGVLLAWLTACGDFAWEILGYPCGGGLYNLCSKFRRFSVDLFFAFQKNRVLLVRPLNSELHKYLSLFLLFDVLGFELCLWYPPARDHTSFSELLPCRCTQTWVCTHAAEVILQHKYHPALASFELVLPFSVTILLIQGF